MGSTQAQNVQRGVVFVTLVTVIFFFIVITVRLVKKLIDPISEEEAGEAYKEDGKSGEVKQDKPKPVLPVSAEDSQVDFDAKAKKQQKIEEDDPAGIKMAKKTQDYHVFFYPLMITFPFNLLTGTTFSFLMVNYFAVTGCLVFFNIIKVHRLCGAEHKCIRVILQNLGLGLSFFFLLNVWGATPISQPYSIV